MAMLDIAKGTKWIREIAYDDTHGYNQEARDGHVDYDCSSLVFHALVAAGMKHAHPSFSTRTMGSILSANGFIWHSGTRGLQAGDILWKVGHTAWATSPTYMVEACIDENGNIWGGKPGDQTGGEIREAPVAYYAWVGYWRYEPMLEDKDIEKIWAFNINGVQARDRLQGIDGLVQSCNKQLTRTDDPSGRDVNMNMYEHLKWLAAAVQELNEKVDKLLGNE